MAAAAGPAPALAGLNHAIDTTPIIDNHCHPLLKPAHLTKYPLLSIVSEAHGDALADAVTSLAHARATRQLASVLGFRNPENASWDAVADAIRERWESDPQAWTRTCLRGIETLLLDDGLDGRDEVQGLEWHDDFVASPCKRIVRIEIVATEIIRRHVEIVRAAGDGGYDLAEVFEDVLDDFRDELLRAIGHPQVVGFKSIICYRGGLDVPHMWDVGLAMAAFQETVRDCVASGDPFKRLQNLPLNHLLVHLTAKLIQESDASHKKPIQFHTGLGDNDITLTKSSPSHLQNLIRQYPKTPFVLLHGGYPWTRELGYLAATYSNVYADIGEVFPFISRDGQEGVVRQILEFCPWSKILWSTDGHWFPETYLLATIQIRSVLKTVLGDYVRQGQLREIQAIQLVQDILFANSKKLYDLEIETKLQEPSAFLSASASPGSAVNNDPATATIAKLRSLDCRWLRLCWHDYTSSTRCRLIPMRRVISVLESGKPFNVSVTKACLGLLAHDIIIPGMSSAGMYNLCPDWNSLRVGPSPGHASVFGDFRELDGSESRLCPRTLLRKTLDPASAGNLEFLVGFELEFVIIARNPDPTAAEKYRTLPNDGHTWCTTRALVDHRPAGDNGYDNGGGRGVTTGFGAAAIDELADALEAAGIDMEQFHPESAPGQYELVLPPLAPLAACDTLLHARTIVEAVAARRGLRVTLHPKPFPASCGTASHAHVSFATAAATTTMTTAGADEEAEKREDVREEVCENFYAGVLRRYPALLALVYAHPASYERMVDSAWAGGRWVAWGTQNKETPLRKIEGSHWEVKTLDGMANPYFALAAVLAAGLEGVRCKEKMVWKDFQGDAALLGETEREKLGIRTAFPANLGEAIKELEKDEKMGELLGRDFVNLYANVKKAEIKSLEGMKPEERRQWILERY